MPSYLENASNHLTISTKAQDSAMELGKGIEPKSKWRHHPRFPFFLQFSYLLSTEGDSRILITGN